jgi:hypothetical protein
LWTSADMTSGLFSARHVGNELSKAEGCLTERNESLLPRRDIWVIFGHTHCPYGDCGGSQLVGRETRCCCGGSSRFMCGAEGNKHRVMAPSAITINAGSNCT